MTPKTIARDDLLTRVKDGHLGGDETLVVYKVASGGGESVGAEADRTLRFTISTDGVDRDNDVVNQKGWKLEAYKSNPVVLWAHDYSALPVAKTLALGLEDGALKATAQFAEYPFADTVYQLLKGGFLNATSVGFAPKEAKVNKERDGVDFEAQELLEFSIVPVPANPEALIEARAKGVDLAPLQKWAKDVLRATTPPSSPSELDGPGGRHARVFLPTGKLAFYRPVTELDPADTLRWNPALSKAFDVDGEPVEPALLEYKWASRFLDVPVKDLYETTLHVPGARMGALLSALDEGYGRFECRAVRNITSRGEEAPPAYETVQLNSKLQRSFLVEGSRFLTGDFKMVVRTAPSWSGVAVTFFAGRPAAEKVVDFVLEARTRAAQYKFLKGEAFALSGEFLERGTASWSELFLDAKAMEPIRRSAQLLNEKGAAMESRGQILMGPPGTGKTLAARALMSEAKDATFIWVSSRDFCRTGAFGGIEMAYDLAAENAPAVVLFEDIDSWWDSYSIDLLKTELDGLKKRTGIVTLLTTNFPETLPTALIDRPGRFHDVVELGLPTEDVRRQMLGAWAEGADGEALDALAKETDGLSGAHLRELVRFAGTIREQDGLELGPALVRALEKVREQRELIDAVQAGRRVRRAVKQLEVEHRVPLVARKGGAGHCDRCHAEGDLAVGVCATCREELHAWSHEAATDRTVQMAEQPGVVQIDYALLAAEIARAMRDDAAAVKADSCCSCDGEAKGATCKGCGHKMCDRHRKNENCPHCYASAGEGNDDDERPEQKAVVLNLDDDVVLELDDDQTDDDDTFDVSPGELRAVLRGAIAGSLGELVRRETDAALNRARGRVD